MDGSLVEQSDSLLALLQDVPSLRLRGRVADVSGLAVDVVGLSNHVSVGDRVDLRARNGGLVPAEIVAFRDGRAQAMTYVAADGLGPGAEVEAHLHAAGNTLAVADSWIGRIIDPLGRALDRRGPLPRGPQALPTRRSPPEATARARLGPRIDLGVGVLNAFTTCRSGQRLGLFAGSGIGKSVLLAMLARNCACDVAVLALVGERGREVREFIEDDLGAEGLARSVVVVATSDASPLMRRQAAYSAMTIAEHFRDQGKNVLFLMDSVTRFCLGLREIGLSAGQPPATRGYPPSVFAELPRLLERAGPGEENAAAQGSITALFTVLVEGDDHNEPVADAVRGIVDGHVVLDRQIAERGRYPAVDVLRSLSRAMPGCNSADETALIRRARGVLALYAEMADLVRLGAYRAGTDPAVDEAVRLAPKIEALLRQDREASVSLRDGFDRLRAVFEIGGGLMSRALEVVGRLRKLAVDQARRELAARLAAEAAAAAAEQAALAGMQRERETARTLRVEEGGGAFAAWVPRGLHAIAVAHDASAHAVGATAVARTALTSARAAGMAVQQMQAREAALLAAAAARREQAVLDELGQRCGVVL